MIRGLCFVAIIISSLRAVPILENVPQEFKDILPSEVREYLTGLKQNDLNILLEVFKENHKTDEESLNAVKERSEELYVKYKKLTEYVAKLADQLSPEAKEFGKKIGKEFMDLSGNTDNLNEKFAKLAKKLATAYTELSAETKEDLAKHFPGITSNFFKMLIEKMMTIE